MRAERFCRKPSEARQEARLSQFLRHMWDTSTDWQAVEGVSNAFVGASRDDGDRPMTLTIMRRELEEQGATYFMPVEVIESFDSHEDGEKITPGYRIGPTIPYSEVYNLFLIALLDDLFPLVKMRVEEPGEFEKVRQEVMRQKHHRSLIGMHEIVGFLRSTAESSTLALLRRMRPTGDASQVAANTKGYKAPRGRRRVSM